MPDHSPTLYPVSVREPVGIEAAFCAASDPSFEPRPTLFEKEFSLVGRVAVVTGGQNGQGLEMAEALAEAGATVYCLDLPMVPDEAFHVAQAYVSKLGLAGNARLEYRPVDVTDQKAIWDIIEIIAEKEGRLDVCIVAAGTLVAEPCLEYSKEGYQKLFKVNVDGVFYSAQAAGGQMTKFRVPGSIILITSVSNHPTNRNQTSIAYNTSKAAILQMGRSLAQELGPKNIRVNTVSSGERVPTFSTSLTERITEKQPQSLDQCNSEGMSGRMGEPKGLRGVAVWLASDASAFCTGSDIIVTGGTHI